MPGARMGVTARGVTGLRAPPGPPGLTMPAGPRARTGCPGAAARGLTVGRLPGLPGACEPLAFKNSSLQRVSGSRLPSRIWLLTSAWRWPYV